MSLTNASACASWPWIISQRGLSGTCLRTSMIPIAIDVFPRSGCTAAVEEDRAAAGGESAPSVVVAFGEDASPFIGAPIVIRP